MSSAKLNQTLDELNALCKIFSEAEAGIKKGEIIDMSGLDARVASVCETVQQAMPEQQKEFLPELTVLINLLGSYEKSLREMHASVTEEHEKLMAEKETAQETSGENA